MLKIFQPILHHALIYIDDIFLFLSTHEEHRQLLNQFFDIIHTYRIMLSVKKSTIATNNIEFLGMIIKDRHYQPGKHIAQEVLHFPNQHCSTFQINNSPGNRYSNSLASSITSETLFLMSITIPISFQLFFIKKKPPEWNDNHTVAVTTLKMIAQNPPPLKLIIDGKQILQTDASDKSWGAILLEEINGKETFIAYASGHFFDTQQHYHIVYKEILAVKNGIKKFEYHFIDYHFHEL